MDFKTEQDKFDQIKWFDSMKEGRDMCGTYEFCSCCKKEPTYPCARAAHRYQSGSIRIAIQEKGDIAAFFREKSPFLFEKEI